MVAALAAISDSELTLNKTCADHTCQHDASHRPTKQMLCIMREKGRLGIAETVLPAEVYLHGLQQLS